MKLPSKEPILYRKRLIPNECIRLKDDIILTCNSDIILTKWKALKPKKDLHHGYSCYFLKEGFKISKFYRSDNTLLYWYCDIVKYDYDQKENVLTVTDLLADVIVYPDGSVHVVDLDELAEAFEKNLLSSEQMTTCLRQLNHLLSLIYRDKCDHLQSYFEKMEL